MRRARPDPAPAGGAPTGRGHHAFRRSAGARAVAAALAIVLAAGCGEGEPEVELSSAEIVATRTAGLAALQQDRLDDARAAFERLVAAEPADPAGYHGLGLVALRAGALEDAEGWLERARERAPDDGDVDLALAALRFEAGDAEAGRAILRESLARDSTRARAWWALATLGDAAPGARVDALEAAGRVRPGNLAILVERIDARLAAGDAPAALADLETLRQVAPDLPDAAMAPFSEAVEAARRGDSAAARAALARFRDVFEVTPAYQADIEGLRPPSPTLVGIPRLEFSYEVSLRVREEEAVLAALEFEDATAISGLAELATGGPPGAVAAGDIDGDGDQDLFWSAGDGGTLLRGELGRFVEADALPGGAGLDAVTAVLADLDDDRRLDLFLGGRVPRVFRQLDDGSFGEGIPIGPEGAGGVRRALAADLDQDGDLDVFEARRGANRLYRNNGDLTFDELAQEAGVAGPAAADTRDVAFADLDHDLDLDLVLAEGAGGLTLLENRRGGRFADATRGTTLEGAPETTAVALGDLDGDGWSDVVAAGPDGLRVLPASIGGSFAAAPAMVPLGGLVPAAVALVDFDNDGWLDVIVAGPGGLRLFRNAGEGALEPADGFLPASDTGAVAIAVTDYNEDGDADLVLLAPSGAPRLLRNDGGSANHFLRLALTGLGDGSRKNNRFGIGARVEVRVGDRLESRTVTDPTTLVGLDGRLKADVIRVWWPNGVSQDLFFPGTDQDLVEQQSLKGSCPLLYTWDGEGYRFVGDVMWKSALGMPLGILGGEGSRRHAPAFPSQEYRRLPDGALVARDGELALQLTEELWEAIYVDEIELVAVDHPDSVEVFVDERFVPPAPTDLRLWRAGTRRRPVAATDAHGRDLLDALAARDFTYVGGFAPGRFQGIAEPHELILDLGPGAGDDVVLFLTGWVFPTDASINVAMAQSDGISAAFPALDVIGPDGRWRTVIPDLGIPSGKDKTVIADLRGLFPTADRRVRIRTNLMVYWDEAFFTAVSGAPGAQETRVTRLAPRAADLHYRGFSREYRRGRDGPHWFDYDDVSTAPRWNDLAGRYTRYGDVTTLLGDGDDRYVAASAGDELTVRFAAADAPELPPGWARTWIVYTDGWVKDGDLNTATGDRVDPYPSRRLRSYPPAADDPGLTGPERAAFERFIGRVQTRVIGERR